MWWVSRRSRCEIHLNFVFGRFAPACRHTDVHHLFRLHYPHWAHPPLQHPASMSSLQIFCRSVVQRCVFHGGVNGKVIFLYRRFSSTFSCWGRQPVPVSVLHRRLFAPSVNIWAEAVLKSIPNHNLADLRTLVNCSRRTHRTAVMWYSLTKRLFSIHGCDREMKTRSFGWRNRHAAACNILTRHHGHPSKLTQRDRQTTLNNFLCNYCFLSLCSSTSPSLPVNVMWWCVMILMYIFILLGI